MDRIRNIFTLSFSVQLLITWAVTTFLLLIMFYCTAPLLGHILVLPVKKFDWALFLANHSFFANLYRSFIWICYFIPLLYIFNVIFTFVIYLCLNKEILKQENTWLLFKTSFLNSIKILALQLPAAVVIAIVISIFGITKTILILTPFSTDILRVLIFCIWLISLIIVQMAFALKVSLKPALSYSILLLKSYKFTWLIFALLLFNLSYNLAKGIIYLVPSFASSGFLANLCLTAYALGVYILVVAAVLHYLFAFEKPFNLENEL